MSVVGEYRPKGCYCCDAIPLCAECKAHDAWSNEVALWLMAIIVFIGLFVRYN